MAGAAVAALTYTFLRAEPARSTALPAADRLDQEDG
jgi:hypothetical protein